MPIIVFEGPELDVDTKRGLAKRLTDALAETFPKMSREHFIILIKENKFENLAANGQLFVDMTD